MSEPGYFFVVGSPRSGTTLLQTMLMRAPGVTMPPELHFVNITYQRRSRMADVRSDEGWAQAISAIVARSERSEIHFDRPGFEESCSRSQHTYADLLRRWLDAIRTGDGASIVGEKTPDNAKFVLELSAMIPEARFIHIIRDPRDSALSQREAFHMPALQSAVRWKIDLERHRDCMRLMSHSRYAAVRYEDLVTDPEQTLRGLCEFLQIEFRPEMLDPSGREKRGFASFETHKLRTLEKVTASRIGRYKGKMSRLDIAVVEHFCGQMMLECGYQLERKPAVFLWIGLLTQAPRVAIRRALGRRRLDQRLRREAEGGRAVVLQGQSA